MMNHGTRHRWVPLLLAALWLTSCSTLPKDFETPRVNIANLTPKDVALFEQRFDVQLRIQNPNDMDLVIKGVRCDIDVNDREFGTGLSGQNITVPRFGSEIVNVEVITSLGSFLRQVQDMSHSSGSKFRYRLKGTAFVESPGHFKVPFDEKGEFDLNLETPAGAQS
jgi:LEA14-like dessication related protein